MENSNLDTPANLDEADTAPQKFMVAIRIIEAKQLAGIDLDPFVRVAIGKDEKQTRTKKSTATPTFEEDFGFEYNITPAIFFDQVIKIQVFSASRLFRRRRLIGEFQIDVATVYHQPGHFFFEKWALLVDPKEPSSPPKGYVLCSIVIDRPADPAKLPHSKRGILEDEDVENNLLVPENYTGWSADRDPAHYMVTIHKAEGLPNTGGKSIMASMKKALKANADTIEYVDPYVSVAFAGMQAKTTVISNCAKPEWNERITFTDLFPTFSESIRVHVRDSTQGVISTSILDFKVISDSSAETGYAPTFGPAYVNLYGSFRGNTEPNPMNFALAEGVAYRGRLLLSVEVQPLADEKMRVTLHKTETKATKFGPDGFNDTREKFFLFCCILEASMLDKRLEGRPVHFELSIGEYGTTEYSNEWGGRLTLDRRKSTSRVNASSDPEDDDTPLLPLGATSASPYETIMEDDDGCCWRSCTTPLTAVADEHYCSIPYGVRKPCMFVVSQWEDYIYRYHHVNQLTQVAKNFERKLADVERALEMGLETEARIRMRSACDTLITAASEYTSYLESDSLQDDLWHTDLDKEKRKQRKRQMDQIGQWCRDFRQQATSITSDVRVKLEEAVSKLHTLKILAVEPQEVMPDIFLWLISGNRRVAYRRFKPYELLYAENRQERGVQCGKVQSFFLKVPGSGITGEDDEQFPIWGHVSAYFWLSRASEKAGYIAGLPKACRPASTPKEERDPQHVPPQYLHYKESHTFELRCHIYQGRALMASDESGLSDPFVRVILGGHVHQTQIIEQSVNPIWDECLIMPQVELLGSTKFVKQYPPSIIMQVYDYDQNNTYEFIGLADVQPVVKLAQDPYIGPEFPPKLRWYPLYKSNHRVGEILAAFELIQLHKDMIDYYHPPLAEETDVGPITPIPAIIRPKLSKYEIQVMFWGIRDLKSAGYFNTIKPVIEIECAGMVLESDPIKDYAKQQNFNTIIKTLTVKSFGRSTLIGSTTIPSLSILVHREAEQVEESASEILGLDDQLDTEMIVAGADEDAEETEAGTKQSVMSYQESLLAASQSDEELSGRDHDDESEMEGRDSVIIIDEEAAVSGEHSEPTAQRPPSTLTSLDSQKQTEGGGFRNEAFVEDSDDDSEPDRKKRWSSKKKAPAPEAVAVENAVSPSNAVGAPRKSIALEKLAEEGQAPQPRSRPRKKPELVLDWWSKYYASIQAEEIDREQKQKIEKLKNLGQTALKRLKKRAGKAAKLVVDVSAARLAGKQQQKKQQKKIYLRKAEQGDEDMAALLKKMDIAKFAVFLEDLEDQPNFRRFRDCFDIYPLYKGKRTFSEFDDISRTVGKFKGRLHVLKHPIPEDLPSPFPDLSNVKQEIVVRVYIIRAECLMANDPNGLADPYLIVNLGKKKISDRSHRIYGQLNPTFGRMFEFDASLPEDYELTVQVWDWDRITKDDLIGQTKIDIEQRYYTKHRATCGLPKKYEATGYNAWRDVLKPTQILLQLCRQHGLPQPSYHHDKIVVGGITFFMPKPAVTEANNEAKKNRQEAKKNDAAYVPPEDKTPIIDRENLALLALHNTRKVPAIGYELVREHVETRALYLPEKPGMIQGTLEMWVDIFPKDAPYIPEPVDIKPRKPKGYELRIVIYDTKNVILDDYNVLTGLSTVDQYIKGFIAGPDIDGQETDTHYRSLKGEGNFNWRFVFRFEYSDIENKIIHKAKHSLLALTVHEQKIPPVFHLQVWDADEITTDDYLGETIFNLTKIPRGAKSAGSCDVKIMKRTDTINLFSKHSRKIRAWWPFIRRETDGTEMLAGKVDMSMELLTEEEALKKPAGKGHDAPDAMPEPVRPETSFAWFTSPLKFLKYTVWLGMRWRLLMCCIIFFVILFILVFVYQLPQAGADKLVKG